MNACTQKPLEMTIIVKGKELTVTSEMIKSVLAKLSQGNQNQALPLSA